MMQGQNIFMFQDIPAPLLPVEVEKIKVRIC